ncbi:hypothetical protein BGZ82_011361, partial [Podila clonocystis]
MAPLDANVYYTWATTGTEAEIAAKAEQMADSLSETDIAAPPELQAEGLPAACVDVRTKLKASLVSIISLLSTLRTSIPMIGAFISVAAGQSKQLLDYIDKTFDSATKLIATAVDSSLATLQSTLVALGAQSSLSDLLRPLAFAIGAARKIAQTVGECLGDVSALSVEDSYCYSIADLYCGMTQDVQNNTPALPDSSSEEMQRLAAVLDRYRYEVERVAEEEKNEEWKQYAQLGLGVISGVSNALEVCVRVVSNPSVAREELDEDLA